MLLQNIENYLSTINNIPQKRIKAIKNLNKDNFIVVVKENKDFATLVINTINYNNKIKHLLDEK